MATVFSPNKNLIEPASGSFTNAWAAPINGNFAQIDTAFGGTAQINVTGVTAGTYALGLSLYQPPNIEFTGTLTGNLTYVVPAGVGGIWTILNGASGAFTISFGVTGGSSIALAPGSLRSLIVSDGGNVGFADTSLPTQAQANAEAFATAADAVVLSTAESFATNAANTAQNNAQIFAQNANNINTGTVGAAFLPLAGNLGGITIQADPGGTPSGSPGDIFYYY
jgi:hypothetical protein